MIGIEGIGSYLPDTMESNLEKLNKFSINKNFVTDKIGFLNLRRKAPYETTSDLASRAFSNLVESYDLGDIECICLCTQNGDHLIPQTASIIQHKLGLPHSCAAFDISMSCSGYVYGLHIAKAFMDSNGFKRGLFFTADPYSGILSKYDKNTNLLFGDAATVTLLTNKPAYEIKKADFITCGQKYGALMRKESSTLEMDGWGILNFCSENAVSSIKNCLKKNALSPKSVDLVLLHQASKFIVDMISKKTLKAFPDFQGKIPFEAKNIGNTVSSTIPLLLRNIIKVSKEKSVVLCGFGGGLSIATTVVERVT